MINLKPILKKKWDLFLRQEPCVPQYDPMRAHCKIFRCESGVSFGATLFTLIFAPPLLINVRYDGFSTGIFTTEKTDGHRTSPIKNQELFSQKLNESVVIQKCRIKQTQKLRIAQSARGNVFFTGFSLLFCHKSIFQCL